MMDSLTFLIVVGLLHCALFFFDTLFKVIITQCQSFIGAVFVISVFLPFLVTTNCTGMECKQQHIDVLGRQTRFFRPYASYNYFIWTSVSVNT